MNPPTDTIIPNKNPIKAIISANPNRNTAMTTVIKIIAMIVIGIFFRKVFVLLIISILVFYYV